MPIEVLPTSLTAVYTNAGVRKKLDLGQLESRPRSGKRSKGDTTTRVPVDSRTTVQTVTQEVLTAGFGMGPGRHLRYGRVQLLSNLNRRLF